jgi:TonB family protein
MSLATFDPPMAPPTPVPVPHGEPPLSGRPAPPWRPAVLIAILLAILLHAGGVVVVVEGRRFFAPPPPPPKAIPVSIVMQPPPVAEPPKPKPPPPKPKPPEPKPPEPKPAPPPPPPPPPEPQTELRQSGPDQRTTVLRDELEKKKTGASPGQQLAAPPPEPTAPPQAPRPAPPKKPTVKRPTPPPSPAPPSAQPSYAPQSQLGPNGFVVPSRPKRQEYAAQAPSSRSFAYNAPQAAGVGGKDEGFYSEDGLTGDPYLNMIRDRVKQNLPADNDLAPNRLVVIGLAIDRSGKVSGYYLLRSSGQDRIDQMVLLAVQRAQPFPPVPPSYPPGDPIHVQGILYVPSF